MTLASSTSFQSVQLAFSLKVSKQKFFLCLLTVSLGDLFIPFVLTMNSTRLWSEYALNMFLQLVILLEQLVQIGSNRELA